MGPLASLLVTGDDTLRIEPPRATLGELQLTNRLQMIRVEGDVLDVADTLKRIDKGLVLMFDKNVRWEDGRGKGIYVLYHEGFDEKGHWCETFVGAYRELDQRIVNLIRRVDAQGRGRYNLARELDDLEKRKDRENEARAAEQFGDTGERLRHALRNDLGATGSSVQMGGGRGISRTRKEKKAQAKRRRQGTR